MKPVLDPADVAIGLVGAALVVPVELAALGTQSTAALVTAVVLMAGLGLGIGVAIAGAEAMARERSGPARAAIRALPSLFVTVPVGMHLFEGAFATTLPGAGSAPLWFPLVCAGLVAIVVGVGEAAVSAPRRRLAVAGLLAVAVVATDYINRHAQRSEYLDIHTLLVVVECVGAGLAARLVVPARRWPRATTRQVRIWRLATASVIAALAGCAAWGLADAPSRWAIATRGMHTRLLVRAVRGAIDVDRDGYSPALGGMDCDDFDAEIHPGAAEVEGNDVDENCDGRTTASEETQRVAQAARRHLEELEAWHTSPQVVALLERTRRYDVVLLAIDTLRGDVVADTAVNRAAYPNLFALLDQSRWFQRAFAPSAGTDLSMSGLLTGRIDPFGHATTTLGEAAKEQGRTTHAVIQSEVIRYVGKGILTRGLDGYDRLVNDRFERDKGHYTTSARTTVLATQFLDSLPTQTRPPYLFWLHYFDVHEHHEIRARDKAVKARAGTGAKLGPVDKYRLMVAIVDEQIGAFVAALRERGLWDRTVLVMVSDHGEGLGEDPRLPDNHGRFLYNPLIHVPVAIRIPGVAPARIETAVSLLDVYPTLVDLMGGNVEVGDGVTLLPHLVDGAPRELTSRVRPLALNETDQYGVIVWPHKLMVRRGENLVELYDLATDFGEQRDLSAEQTQRVEQLKAAYAALSPVSIDRTRKGRRQRDKAAKAAARDLSDDVGK